MERFDIFQDIAERTNGDVYIGVVGPVRTGKSTLIKRFMDLLVLPNITDPHDRGRATDELPQSGAGRTIMTTEPKFVPDQGVEVALADGVKVRVRLVDCVGYTVGGALGYEEEDGPRMVRTPWFEEAIPFQDAAELGTRKVISEHSTIGLVVTTDGSITDIDREHYVDAEKRVIGELKQLGKPFLVLVNSTNPQGKECQALRAKLEEEHGVRALAVDCMHLSANEILSVLGEILYEFPVREINIRLPRWVERLGLEHTLRSEIDQAVLDVVEGIEKVRDVDPAVVAFGGKEWVQRAYLQEMELGSGTSTIEVVIPQALFYEVIADLTGFTVEGDHHLLSLLQELAVAKREYDKVAAALQNVEETGYGIVMPNLEDITFDQPEMMKQGSRFGVKLRASAPSIHMIRAEIVTEVTPFVGTEKQGEEMVKRFTEEFEADPNRIWNLDFLGRSLPDLVKEGISSKLHRMPDNAQEKLQETLTKIINEGSGGLICIIL